MMVWKTANKMAHKHAWVKEIGGRKLTWLLLVTNNHMVATSATVLTLVAVAANFSWNCFYWLVRISAKMMAMLYYLFFLQHL